MRFLRDAEPLASFFQRLSSADKSVLLLDYDGTLAEFTVDRYRSVPYPGVREIIAEIIRSGNTRTVVISGRAVSDLTALLGLSPLPEIWGSHGWEHLSPEGAYRLTPLDPSAQSDLLEGRVRLDRLGLAERREDKPVSVAVHWRGLTSTEVHSVRVRVMEAWSPLAENALLEIHPFDGGLELRAKGRNKGSAVATILLEEGPFAVAAYLGDDLTDEDAFRAMADKGLRVLVRTFLRDTLADLWLIPPQELLGFLKRWLNACTKRI